MDVLPLLIVDYGNVLYEIDFQRTIDALSALPGYNGSAIRFGVDEQLTLFFNVDRGLLTTDEFRAALRERFGFTCTDAEIDAAWCAILKAPFPFAAEALHQLRERFKPERMVMLSNISELHIAHAVPRSPFLEQFDELYFSCRIGKRKPDVEAFEHVLSSEGYQAHQAVLFDDSRVNCDVAKGLGIRVVRVTPGDPRLAFRELEAA